MQERGPAAYVAELIGTFALVFFITAAISLYVTPPPEAIPGAPPQPQPFIDFSVIGLVHVFALFMLVQTLAVISGAHVNPAVTAGLAAIRQIRPADAGIYIVCQLAGGVLGALTTKALLTEAGRDIDYGALTLSTIIDEKILPGMVLEGIATFFLVWAVIGVAVRVDAPREWAALVIGGTLGLGVMVIGPVTGAGINPARAFGPALVGSEFGGADTFILVYVLGPVIGAVLAARIYHNLFILPGKRPPGMEPVG